MPAPSGWTGSLLEWAKAVAGWKLMPRPPNAEGEVGRMVELQRRGQFNRAAARRRVRRGHRHRGPRRRPPACRRP